METPLKNVIGIVVVIMALVGGGSWKASEYVGDNRRVRDENVTLRVKFVEQEKEIEKLREQVRQTQPGWRPGTPIGNPAGSTSPTGATSK